MFTVIIYGSSHTEMCPSWRHATLLLLGTFTRPAWDAVFGPYQQSVVALCLDLLQTFF